MDRNEAFDFLYSSKKKDQKVGWRLIHNFFYVVALRILGRWKPMKRHWIGGVWSRSFSPPRGGLMAWGDHPEFLSHAFFWNKLLEHYQCHVLMLPFAGREPMNPKWLNSSPSSVGYQGPDLLKRPETMFDWFKLLLGLPQNDVVWVLPCIPSKSASSNLGDAESQARWRCFHTDVATKRTSVCLWYRPLFLFMCLPKRKTFFGYKKTVAMFPLGWRLAWPKVRPDRGQPESNTCKKRCGRGLGRLWALRAICLQF